MPEPKFRFNRYGWRRDKPDQRDIKFLSTRPTALPSGVDLRPWFPAPYDQGELGSCVAQSIAGLLHYNSIKKDASKSFQPSALFMYYNDRVIENSINEDSGAEIRNGIKSLTRWGFCPEEYYPYIITKFKSKPPASAYKNALPYRIDQYMRINQNLHDLKSCLADESPFVFGMMVYESFESEEVSKTGVVVMPDRNERAKGGHAVCCVGYEEEKQEFIVRNSWGIHWGMQGYFTIPYDYVLNSNLVSDFWMIKR